MSEQNIGPLNNAARPRFSVVIPTRDRPEYARNALESVLRQSFSDLEVIVCDNFLKSSCKTKIEAFDDPRVRYVAPPAPLAMHDNWEFAIDQARGDYVLVLIDKTLLRHCALAKLQAATQSHPADIYSWTSDAYYLTHEADGDVGRGYLVPVRGRGEPFYVNTKQEIASRISCRERLGTEGPSYVYGKICFGAYSRELIARIKARFGRVCTRISPDYTSKAVALLSTDQMVDLGSSYLVSLNTSISNGKLFSENTDHARGFLAQGGFTEDKFGDLPIPNVFCSVHNLCAYDWRMIGHAIPGHNYVTDSLDAAALFVQVERDLEGIKNWASDAERQEISDHMRSFFNSSPAALRERIVDAKRRVFEQDCAAREKQLADLELWIKGREDHVKYREDAVLARENRPFLRTAKVIARGVYSPLRAIRRLNESLVALSSIKSEKSTAQASEKSQMEPQRGYPAFTTTQAALVFAETEQYQHPLPILPAGQISDA